MKLRHAPLSIPAHGEWLDGVLAHAPDVRALALCVDASGQPPPGAPPSALEQVLQAAGFATMTVDLLTRQEAQHDTDAPFNIPRLTERILATMDWLAHQPSLEGLAIGLIASGTGCAAAIRAAASAPQRFAAIACLDGRADLAGAAPLRAVRTPTRFIVMPDSTEAPMLASAHALLEGEHDWLQIMASGDEHDAQLRAAQAACAWLASHLPQTGQPDAASPPPPA